MEIGEKIMVWSEFWNGLFTKYLQYSILAILVTITIVIFLLLCFGVALGMDYLDDKHANAKRKRDLDDEYYAKAFEALQEKKRAIMNRINKAKAEKETQNGATDISNRKEETNDQ